jgi:hypothetical protein
MRMAANRSPSAACLLGKDRLPSSGRAGVRVGSVTWGRGRRKLAFRAVTTGFTSSLACFSRALVVG